MCGYEWVGLNNDDVFKYYLFGLILRNYIWAWVSMFDCKWFLWTIHKYARVGWLCINMNVHGWTETIMWKYKDGYKRIDYVWCSKWDS